MAVVSTYIDPFTYQRASTGLDSSSLVGNLLRLSSAVVIGATSLSVTPATTVALNQYDRITLFDGINSEVVTVTSSTAIGATSIPVSATVAAHAVATPLCSDGTAGSLSDELVNAGSWLENICQQSLYQQSYTETLRMPSMRGSIDNRNMLVFRPRHFPVSVDSGIVIKANNADPVSYDASQVILDGGSQVVNVPWLTVSTGGNGSGSTYSLLNQVSRSSNLFLTISYTAGYATIPGDVRNAATLLTSDLLARKQNPVGADSITQGKRQVMFVTRGDTSGESLLLKRAIDMLSPYIAQVF